MSQVAYYGIMWWWCQTTSGAPPPERFSKQFCQAFAAMLAPAYALFLAVPLAGCSQTHEKTSVWAAFLLIAVCLLIFGRRHGK